MKNYSTLILLAALLLGSQVLNAQAKLNMFIDYNRFLDKDKNTVLLIDYQVPYRSLVFLAQNNGYFAELKVNVRISEADSILFQQEVTDNIGIKNKADADNNQKYYLNRLSFTLDKPKYLILFTAEDLNSEKSFSWSFEVERLPGNSLISDVELNSEVRPDSLQYLAKFKRKNILYKPQPSVLINKGNLEFAHIYLEAYVKQPGSSVLLNLSLAKDSLLVMDEYIDYYPKESSEGISLKIPLEELAPGRYNGSVLVQSEERSEERDFEFVLYEEAEEQIFLFANPDDEYALMRYFSSSRMPSDWNTLDLAKKRRYGTQFWRNMASSINRSPKDALNLIQERVDYANRNFGHLKNGWTSDMGRIYIRNGAPDDVQRDTSSDESRYVRKDYQIWKYSKGKKPVYLFIDVQMNGNFRLIYVENDDMESTNPDWLRYVGNDFDEGKLDN